MGYSHAVVRHLKTTKTNFKKYVAATAVGVIGALAVAIPAWALTSLVLNGSFESGTNPGSFITLTAPNSTDITNWTVSAGSIDYIGTYWQPSEGARSLDLSGNGPGAVSQTFTTVAGRQYMVTFDLAGNPDGGPAVKTLDVSATGGATTPYTFDVTGHTKANMGWLHQTYNFTATGASTTLTFASTTATAYGPALDNVVVTEKPPVKVTIDKYVDGAHATTVTANNSAFPMASSWNAVNLGGPGSGTYALSPTGFNTTTPYQAVTSDMAAGSSYATNEVTTANNTVSLTCNATTPFALVGYTSGNTAMAAQNATPSTTSPAFSNLQNDKYVIVWNKTCHPTTKNQCKNDGWKTFVNPSFENQGQCVSYFNHQNHTTNNNNINVTNNNTQNAQSGNANVRNNTTGGNATSGDASNSNSNTNNVNVNNGSF